MTSTIDTVQNAFFLVKTVMQLDAFSQNIDHDLPLAAKLRPRSLTDFFGQAGIRSQLEKLVSHPRHVIFWGPPGTGKTTLAHILSSQIGREIQVFSAVTSGIPELKKLIQTMMDQRRELGKESILFIDEIHRFNKSQQDALLPYLENGDFLFIGATTEYPHTSLNKALIARVSLVELKQLNVEELTEILLRGINDLKRTDLKDYVTDLAKLSNGDARFALNQLARLSAFNKSELENKEEVIKELFEHARQYDRNANRHYDVISAFIKSIRGSDPQAAVYYLARMVEGGEDPKFIARRMLILASEDIGLANPNALLMADACFRAVTNIGWPESRIILSQCAIFLATSAKSNASYMAIDDAIAEVKRSGDLPVPLNLRNAPTKLMKDLGYGTNYQYSHMYDGNFAFQEFLPDGLSNSVFYNPGKNQREDQVRDWLKSRWKDKYEM
jgi:putative ATPase